MTQTKKRFKSIILFGGSFDPIHMGHIKTVKEIITKFPESLILVIPSLNKLKNKGIIPLDLRIQTSRLAFKSIKNVKIVDWSEHWDTSSTYDVVAYAEKQYPKSKIFIAAGVDVLESLHLWSNFEKLIEKKWIICCRAGYSINPKSKNDLIKRKFVFLNTESLDVSSSDLKKDPTKLKKYVPQNVLKIVEPWIKTKNNKS
jgi:nicotinate-nucleotide adenylyltransferase